jgi:hypothetical protein
MSASRFVAIALLFAVSLALRASPSEQGSEPDERIEWNPDPIIEAILKSDLPATDKVARLSSYVRVGDDLVHVADRLGYPRQSFIRMKKETKHGDIHFGSGLVVDFDNGKVTGIEAMVLGRKKEILEKRKEEP